ncbi:MAG TPA: dockerin type I domain-containing protein, partial [Lacipirellulaceae bacterium]
DVFLADPTLITYDFNRVGFFAGSALGADQINLTNVDVTLSVPGDTNGDNLVDSVDYANIVSHFNQMVTSRQQGDLNGDGIVDLSDFHEWKANQTSGAGQSSIDGSVVPEPASWALAAVGAILLVLQRQRHLRHLARCSLC